MTAIVSGVICAVGMAIFLLYNEGAVLKSLAKKEKLQ
jgi:hypothetical protein